MKWLSVVFMLVPLVYLTGIALDFIEVMGWLFLFYLFLPLHNIICMWRLYRIRLKEGKRALPGYWELEPELWEPMAPREKLWSAMFCGLVILGSLALLIFQKLGFESMVLILPYSGFSAISYIFACYRPPMKGSGNKSPHSKA